MVALRRLLRPRNILLSLVLLGAVAYYGSYLLTDYLWFASLDYVSVFATMVLTKLILWVAVAAGVLLFILGNLALARRDGPPQPLLLNLSGEYGEVLVSPRALGWASHLFAGAVAVVLAGAAASRWVSVLQFVHATPFGIPDPFFGRDVGFYVFSLPVWRALYRGAMAVLILTLIAVLGFYLANRGIDFVGRRLSLSRRAARHLAVLAAAAMALKAGGYYLAQLNLLYSPRGVAFGASYTDIHAQLPVLRILMVVAVAVAGLVVFAGWRRRYVLGLYGLAFLVASSLILGTAYPAFIQQFQVEPDEINKEAPYIRHNIAFTRAAFGLDRVSEREFSVTNDLTKADILNETATIENIRLWDWGPLRDSYGQLQAIRLYYDFADVDLDRYTVDGRYRQVTVAARELNHELLPVEARTWMNIHLKYTHGYGVVMSPTVTVTSEGMPAFYVKDIPPVSTVESVRVTRPEIYYGELTREYAIVNTKTEEFDYPVGDQNQYTTYAGTGGVRLSNPLVRLAFAIRLGSYQVALADSITSESRVMFYRQIHSLVSKVAPFLDYDSDPYIVVGDDGRLFYIQDAYTTTDLYPYSEPSPAGFNYIRNAFKISINAYDGRTEFYIWDESDPIARTLAAAFPALFKPKSAMPADMLAHVRYPEDLFGIQADMYATYHMQDPQVFYNREDLYERPPVYSTADRPARDLYAGRRVQPHYMIIRLPGEAREELVQMLPYSPKDKANMIAWIAARSDGERYGELVVYKFPKRQLVYGPLQVEARIDQDTTISQYLTLWSQAGSSVIRGTLLVIPIKTSILYVEPLYLQASGNKLPELKRVIAAYGDRVVMTESLAGCLEAIFGQGAGGGAPGTRPGEGPTGPSTPGTTVAELARRASELFTRATQAASQGDWAAYGDYLRQLGETLRELERSAGAGETGGP